MWRQVSYRSPVAGVYGGEDAAFGEAGHSKQLAEWGGGGVDGGNATP